MQEKQVWSLGQEDPLEQEMETHSSKKEKKKKKDKLDFIQMENFCVSKDTVHRMKR